MLARTNILQICFVFAVFTKLASCAPEFKCVGNPNCPSLILTSQHTAWTRTDFIEFNPQDPNAENEALAANAKKGHVGIPEELIAIQQSNVFKVVWVEANPEMSKVSLVVLRHKLIETILTWIDTYNIIILEADAMRVNETERIVTEIDKKFFNRKVITKVISDLSEVRPSNRIVVNHSSIASLADPLIQLELFKWNRLLESPNEDAFGIVAKHILNLKDHITSPAEYANRVKTINLMSWQLYSPEKSNFTIETLLTYPVSNTGKIFKDFICDKLSVQIQKQITPKEITISHVRQRNAMNATVHDIALIIYAQPESLHYKEQSVQIELSYVEFPSPDNPPYIIYVSELIDLNVQDYPRNTVNISCKTIPSLAECANPKNIPDYFPLPYPANVNNSEAFTLVFGLNRILLYIYDVALGSDNEPISFTDEFTGQDLTGQFPALAKLYSERFTQPNNYFTVRYIAYDEKRTLIAYTKFVILSDGIVEHLKDLVTKYNIVIASNTTGALEKAIVDTLERKVGRIFSRRYTSMDYLKRGGLKEEVLEHAGFGKKRTVHIHVDPVNFFGYLYGAVIDAVEPPYPSGLTKIKSILMNELYTALELGDEPKILATLQTIDNMRFKCINNVLGGNLIISIENLSPGISQIHSSYLRRWTPYFNIIPHPTTSDSVEPMLRLIENEAKENIFSRNFIAKPALANAIFIVAKSGDIRREYRRQTILASDCTPKFIDGLTTCIRNIQSRKGPLLPLHSIEAFNLREFVDGNTATNILGTITPLEEIVKLRVVDLANNCSKSLDRATNFKPTKILRMKKTYSTDEMTGTTFELLGKKPDEKLQVFMVSYLSETLSEVRYLIISDPSEFKLKRITDNNLKAKCN